jgi:glutamate/aspartate transport system permease protein
MTSVLLDRAPDGAGRYLDWIISGAYWTISLGVLAWLIALIVGTSVGIARTCPNALLKNAGRAYVELFRNIPLLVQMFFAFFVLPEFLPRAIGNSIKHMEPPLASFVPALISLGLYTAARVAEQVRAGIESIPKGQFDAAAALGIRQGKMYLLILLPQSFRIIFPALTSEFMNIFKNTSVALTIGLLELTAQARQVNEYTFRTFEAYGAATIGYLLIALTAFGLMMAIERYLRVPDVAEMKARDVGI